MNESIKAGAVAVKPTGAKEGSFVLSMRPEISPENSEIEFIAFFD